MRDRTAEEIVADIEKAARTPVPDDDILSDASGSISDGDVISDGDSDADIDTAEEWELQQARIRSEAMHTIKDRFHYFELNSDDSCPHFWKPFEGGRNLCFWCSYRKKIHFGSCYSKEVSLHYRSCHAIGQ